MSKKQKNNITALIIDDDRMMRILIEEQVESLGYHAIGVGGANEALNLLHEKDHCIDIIILDQEMPEMKGLELLAIMKEVSELRRIPVIMVTAADRSKDIKRGIDAGVFYYLTKPLDGEILKSVFESAVSEARKQSIWLAELQKSKTVLGLLQSCKFTFKTVDEAEDLAAFLAGCYPNPARVLSGLARLMINAVEHGNLAMSYDEKTDFMERGLFQKELKRRARLSTFQNKVVEVLFQRDKSVYVVTITDQGDGFDWRKYLDIDPARAMDSHGRGIAQAKATSFDELRYNSVGNQVSAIVRVDKELDW